MQTVRTIDELRTAVRRARGKGRTISLVPTMGALHEGHLSLVDRAAGDDAFTVVSVFVNPTQFGPGEDLERYPRDLEGDARLCERRGASLVFAPRAREVYPEGSRTWVTVEGITEGLCGAFRPVHFRGVATVVVKLLNMVQPDVAVFGRKDFQQLRVIESAVRDLNLPVRIEGAPTVRDPDGLAMSSRNAYLTDADRQRALTIPRTLARAALRWEEGMREPARILEGLEENLVRRVDRLDYFGLYDPEDLGALTANGPAVRHPLVAVAAHVGVTRLIDNVQLGVDPPPRVD